MKLLTRDDRTEGQIYRDDAYIVFGRQLDGRGWYVLFNLRFVTRHTNVYIDPVTWNPRPALCYRRFRISVRHGLGELSFHVDNAWTEL